MTEWKITIQPPNGNKVIILCWFMGKCTARILILILFFRLHRKQFPRKKISISCQREPSCCCCCCSGNGKKLFFLYHKLGWKNYFSLLSFVILGKNVSKCNTLTQLPARKMWISLRRDNQWNLSFQLHWFTTAISQLRRAIAWCCEPIIKALWVQLYHRW